MTACPVAQDRMSMGDNVSHRRTRRVQFFVDSFGPDSDSRPLHRVGRHQRRFRESFVQVFADDSRFDDYGIIVHQSRDHCLWIQCDIVGRELLALHDVDVATLPGELLFGECETHFCGTSRRPVVEQRQHSLVSCPAFRGLQHAPVFSSAARKP
jgi:hypothetical protein